MQVKVIVTRDLETDGVDQELTLEQWDVGDFIGDSLRVYLEALRMAGFSYAEELEVHKSGGGSNSSNDT